MGSKLSCGHNEYWAVRFFSALTLGVASRTYSTWKMRTYHCVDIFSDSSNLAKIDVLWNLATAWKNE
jgi:hypothetical protein